MSHKHHIRRRDRYRPPTDRLLVQLVARHIRCAVHVVVQRHEQAKICVHARVVQRMIARRVNQVLHQRQSHEPTRDELKVTVPDGVEHVKAEQVHVKHRDGAAAERPRPDERNGEVRGVHQVLHERMHAPGDRFGDKARVMMRVIRTVQFVMMQRAMQPIINELSRPRVQQQQLHRRLFIRRREIIKPQSRHPMHERDHQRLEQYVIIPIILPIDLFKIDPSGLYPRFPRPRVHSRQAYPKLRARVPQRRDRQQVPTKRIPIVFSERYRRHERQKHRILHRSPLRPREVIQRARFRRHRASRSSAF